MPLFKITESFDIDVEFEVFCGSCGEGLYNQSTGDQTAKRGEPYVSVEPCEKCLEKEKSESFTSGRDSRDDEVSELRSLIDSLKDELADLKANQDFDG